MSNILKKAAGLFIDFGESAEAPQPSAEMPKEEWNVMTADTPEPAKPKMKTIEQVVREQPGPNLDEIKVPAEAATPVPPTPPAEPVIGPTGQVNYQAIYNLAALPSVPFTAEQILELFANLPADLPLESKRATIKVTLSAMAKTLGITTEQIVADASRKLAALASYTESYTKQANDYCAKTEIEIISLEQQIADKRKAMEEAKAKQTLMQGACEKESDRLDDVLEFFTLDIPPSKHA